MSCNREHRRRKWSSCDTATGVAQESPLQRWCESLNREFDFSALATILPLNTAIFTAERLCIYFQRFARKTAVTRHCQFINFIESLGGDESVARAFLFNSSPTKIGPEKLWIACVGRYANYLRDKNGSHYTTLAENYGNLFLCLDALADAGIAPKVTKPKLPINYHLTGTRRQSLLEMQGKLPCADSVLCEIQDRIAQLTGSVESEEAFRYASALASKIPTDFAFDEIALIEAIQRQNRSLIDKIRRIAEDKFIYWRNEYELGQNLIKQASLSALDIAERFNCLLSSGTGFREINSLFPKNDKALATGLFLYAVSVCFCDRVPCEVEVGNRSHYQRLLRRFGGRFKLDGMLTAHCEAVAAALILYLCDSGANPSVALELTTDFEEATDDQNLVRVRSTKPRAGYVPIVDCLPIRDPRFRVSAVEALRSIRDMTEKRRNKFPSVGDQLAIFTFYKKPSNANPEFLSNRLNYFARDAGVEERFLPGAIRQSVVMDIALRNEGNLRAINAHTHHNGKSGSTEHYAQSWTNRLILTRRIREFQSHFESALVYNVKDGFNTLGVSEEEAEERFDRAIIAGLAIDNRIPAKNNAICTSANGRNLEAEKHRQCERRLFLLDEHKLVELLVWKAFLTKQRDELCAEALEKWDINFSDVLAYVTVVIEKVERSQYASLIPNARKQAQKISMADLPQSIFF